MKTPLFLNPLADVEKSVNRLPHWEQPGRCYFVTFRMADSIPAELRSQWSQERAVWKAAHPEPHSPEETAEYQQLFTARIERWLDAGHGFCALRRLDCRDIVVNGLRHFDGQRYDLHAWVVMPNHVHVLLSLEESSQLGKVVSSWKSYTANELNKVLDAQGAFWQEDYFDRMIRDADHFVRCVRYIRRNPAKAGLNANDYSHGEDELARRWAPAGEERAH